MLKRAVIKEELVAITGDFISALILNQFLYWSERIDFVDKYIKEEGERENTYGQNPDGTYAKENINYNSLLSQGFIYKKASELNEELMLNLSEVSIRKYIKVLVLKGFLIQRTNPKYKWDKTFQYRVDLLKVRESLDFQGYSLDGYAILKNLAAKQRNFAIEQENFAVELRNLAAIPEITTEITTEITEEEEKKTSSPKTTSFKEKKIKKEKKILSNEEWLNSLKLNKAYEGLDIERLHGKMLAWCEVKGKKPTRARLLNWLNREERPMQGKSSKDKDAPLSPVWLAGAIEGEPKPSPVWLVGADD